jgi:hypothetical protein
MPFVRILITIIAILVPTLASAQAARCINTADWITNDTDANGRNAWAKKCGYIDSGTLTFLTSARMYITFVYGCTDCFYVAPKRETAACIYGLSNLGFCYTGCYTPEQRVSFGGQYIGIQQAFEEKQSTVTALSLNSTERALSYSEQAIRTYVAGDSEELIYVLKTQDGRQLDVTDTHPMVRGTGEVVKARELKAGDVLLGSDGKQVVLEDVSTYRFKGRVWNLQPVSEEKLENIINAEGLLTGSIRFQNEWGDSAFRLFLRDNLSIPPQE